MKRVKRERGKKNNSEKLQEAVRRGEIIRDFERAECSTHSLQGGPAFLEGAFADVAHSSASAGTSRTSKSRRRGTRLSGKTGGSC